MPSRSIWRVSVDGLAGISTEKLASLPRTSRQSWLGVHAASEVSSRSVANCFREIERGIFMATMVTGWLAGMCVLRNVDRRRDALARPKRCRAVVRWSRGEARSGWQSVLAQAAPVLDSLADMLRPDLGSASEIGNRTRYLQYPMVGARRPVQSHHRRLQ